MIFFLEIKVLNLTLKFCANEEYNAAAIEMKKVR